MSKATPFPKANEPNMVEIQKLMITNASCTHVIERCFSISYYVCLGDSQSLFILYPSHAFESSRKCQRHSDSLFPPFKLAQRSGVGTRKFGNPWKTTCQSKVCTKVVSKKHVPCLPPITRRRHHLFREPTQENCFCSKSASVTQRLKVDQRFFRMFFQLCGPPQQGTRSYPQE